MRGRKQQKLGKVKRDRVTESGNEWSRIMRNEKREAGKLRVNQRRIRLS